MSGILYIWSVLFEQKMEPKNSIGYLISSTKYVLWIFKVGIYPVCYLGLFIAFKILDF